MDFITALLLLVASLTGSHAVLDETPVASGVEWEAAPVAPVAPVETESAPLAVSDESGDYLVAEGTDLPACEWEDSDNCYWDASVRGNGEGTSFYVIDGEVTYLD